MAGASASASGMVPCSARMVSHPCTVPGMDTEKGPSWGICRCPAARSRSMDAAPGARPLPFRACTFFSPSWRTRANISPPTPVDSGSTTLRVAAAATAASTALPPCISICSPACAASGWLVATIPFNASTGDRLESKNMVFSLFLSTKDTKVHEGFFSFVHE